MSTFSIASLAGYLSVMLITWRERGRFFAMFSRVALGIFTLVATGMQRQLYMFLGPLRDYFNSNDVRSHPYTEWKTSALKLIRLDTNSGKRW